MKLNFNMKNLINKIAKALTLTMVFIFALLYNLNAQVPITYYSFEDATHKTGKATVEQTINTATGSTLTRSNNVTLDFDDGAGQYHYGLNAGMSISSIGWSMVVNDPGTSATDYFEFKANTSGFESISLQFDYFSNRQNNNFCGPRNIGVLYSIDGLQFTSAGSLSVGMNNWYTLNCNLSGITDINNKSSVTFRIYGFNASRDQPHAALMVDNLTVLALSTTNIAATKTLLNEPSIFTSTTSGGTGYVYLRSNFTVKNNSKVILNNQLAIGNVMTVESGATLDCGNSSNCIYAYDSHYIYGQFILSDNANLLITSNYGIAPENSYYGNIMTAFRTYSPNGNYTYYQNSSDNLNLKINPEKSLLANGLSKSGTMTTIDYSKDKQIVSGTTTASSDKVIAPQRTGSGLPSTVKSVTINNPIGVKLTLPLTITNNLLLSSGNFLTDSCTVFFSNTAINPSESSTSKIVGIAQMNKRYVGTDSINFISANINKGYDNLDSVKIIRKTGPLGTITVGQNSSIQSHWDVVITGTQPSHGRDVTYSWLREFDGANNFTSLNTAQLYTSKDFVTWSQVGADFDVSSSNPVRQMTVTVSHFSFYVATGKDSPMPVKLVSFNASVINGNNIKLNWATSSEQNNAGFEIERAVVGSPNLVYNNIGFVIGNGNSNTTKNYSFTDSKMNTGKYQYRLKQVDNNGNFEYFNLSNEVNVAAPGKYNLEQNYPNPFNPNTNIIYQIANNTFVSLKVYDMTGKEVTTLVNEIKAAGYYTVNFNASNLASGIYIYKLEAGSYTKVLKMVLVK